MSLAQISIDIDEADAVVLQENLMSARALISKISGSLHKISTSTSKSERTLRPMVERQKKLTIFKKNIDESLLAVSNVQGVASEASVYEGKLNERIVDVKTYIATISKAENILAHLNGNDGGEYKGISENLSKTISNSELKLINYFKDLIVPESQGFDPQIFINEKKPFPYVPDEKISDLSTILNYFNQPNKKSIDSTLIGIRSKLINSSLAFLEPFTKPTKPNEKVPYQKGSNGINNYTEAFTGFISNEYALLEDLFNNDVNHITALFQEIISPSVDNFSKIIENILNFIKSNLSNDGLLIFEVIDNIVKILSILRSKSKNSYSSLTKSLNDSRDLSKSLFKDLLKITDQKVNSLINLPQDFGISEVTVDIMSKLRKFSEYKDGALTAMNGMKAGSWIPQPKPQWLSTFSTVSQTNVINENSPIELLSSYFSDVIDALIVSLEIKAFQIYKKKQIVGFFLITNITLVEQIISRSELKSILNEDGMSRLNKLKKRALNYFLTGWKQIAAYLLDVNIVGKLSSKDKELIKDKFKNFNLEFDELVKNYRNFKISDPTLKKFLSKEISFIIPLYHRFYDKHSSGDFTKHTEKYIKYDKLEFDRILDSLGK